MLVCNPYEIVIHGTTSKGKTFRPSDWAERLCGILSSFDKGNRLAYHQWVRPMLVDKVRCVAVDKKLEEINPAMFRFLMDFAADNDLRVMDCKALLDERSEQAEAAAESKVSLAQAIEEKQSAEEQAAREEAGVPAGVLNIVTASRERTPEVVDQWLDDGRVRKITFTGSTPVGKQLAALAGKHMKRVTMELGGHAPVIVAEDADVELAIRVASGAKFRNAGQVCISPTRFLVHESIRPEFVAAFARHAQNLKVGDGLAEGTQMGPLANPRRITAMTDLLADAVQQGAQLAAGGQRIGTEGNFFQPTVLNDVPLSARIFNEEPFGPVAAVRGFEKIEDAIAEANRLPFGLAGYAFTTSLKYAHLLAQRLEVGMLWINQAAAPAAELPFGGLKDSGYGSEGGSEAVEAHLNTRLVSIMNA